MTHSVAEQLRVIDRAVTTLTRSTEALLRASDETTLLNDICSIAVDVAGYRLAWIGYGVNDSARSVAPVARAGMAASYIDEITVSWADNSFGSGPTGTAIRTGATQVVRDAASDPRFAPWREAARRHRLHSMIALPLFHGGTRLGALNIYADEPESFDADVIRLLEDLARNLSYGIGALRMRAEHERAVRDLAESEERYRTLIELTPDAIVVHSQGVVVFANPAAERVFAAPGRALVGHPVTELIDEGIRATAAIRLANPPGGTATAEYRLRRLDGMVFEAEVVATTLTFHGRHASLLVVRDVTEAKHVREQLLQAAKLATLGEMAAGLVHELSQPLNIIRMAAEGALMFIERGKATQEFQIQQFRLVDDQAQRAAEIIDDIRIFSRRDTSPMQVFDALTAVRAAIAVLQGQMRPDDITLLVELPDHPVLVRGRRVQLEQVVMNLLSNAHHALKEMRERGGDEGWNAVVRVSARPVGRELRVIVADNGPGLSPEVRARVFEPFFTTKEAGRGTGLGLSVSFGIVNSMGGRLEVCDSPAGASFSVALPIDGEASLATGTGQDQVPAAAAADAHIMVVDDEAMATSTLAAFLTELGYRVTVCASGSEAYQRFMADPADVVITDLRMPAGGGEQLVEKLRDFDPLLPIVIATGHLGATERLAENLQDDRCAVLKKPVALARLGDLIAGFLQPPD